MSTDTATNIRPNHHFGQSVSGGESHACLFADIIQEGRQRFPMQKGYNRGITQASETWTHLKKNVACQFCRSASENECHW
ncbi:hypothetical protein DM794_20135 [Paenarthrobacter ureafaciens]|uniref:Uncharacterized protein n=1 Tax=Paenarthrobacter nitroguajacolicus TaxID=211146 RepID=A0A558H6F6_PAENT|nr:MULTISPECIES: hypothetical protein [Paenarthrobacter]NWL29339.1 hypothetical protein [Paenarthrobacter ureafaciens]QSZ52003.1 hypothetical protein AYX19_02580 [Paenarthrobacter ureafaciens]TVU64707.1 hypothetical protein FQP90_06470 [Paenarthrobacter nitroguajacolicus]WOC61271.1 hypothetical protein RI444_00990 [Paenarthrobacter sp. AT5]